MDNYNKGVSVFVIIMITALNIVFIVAQGGNIKSLKEDLFNTKSHLKHVESKTDLINTRAHNDYKYFSEAIKYFKNERLKDCRHHNKVLKSKSKFN